MGVDVLAVTDRPGFCSLRANPSVFGLSTLPLA
jgi:hypothetical protein